MKTNKDLDGIKLNQKSDEDIVISFSPHKALAILAVASAIIIVLVAYLLKNSNNQEKPEPKQRETEVVYSVEIDGKTYTAKSESEIDKIIDDHVFGSLFDTSNEKTGPDL